MYLAGVPGYLSWPSVTELCGDEGNATEFAGRKGCSNVAHCSSILATNCSGFGAPCVFRFLKSRNTT